MDKDKERELVRQRLADMITERIRCVKFEPMVEIAKLAGLDKHNQLDIILADLIKPKTVNDKIDECIKILNA